ncbi:MAG TPA: four helix bundle protein [Mucilaginibacter sp.]|jgi:TIGR02436 family protein
MRDDKENLIVTLTFQFALDIIKFEQELESEHKYVIAKQILKSGTSIGANVREAQNAESKSDFIHKLKIAAKETDETEWEKVKIINKVLSKIISSSKSG